MCSNSTAIRRGKTSMSFLLRQPNSRAPAPFFLGRGSYHFGSGSGSSSDSLEFAGLPPRMMTDKRQTFNLRDVVPTSTQQTLLRFPIASDDR